MNEARLGLSIRRAFEAQAGNSPLQGQSKPPAKPVVMIMKKFFNFESGCFLSLTYDVSIKRKRDELVLMK